MILFALLQAPLPPPVTVAVKPAIVCFSNFKRILGARTVLVIQGPIDTGDLVERP